MEPEASLHPWQAGPAGLLRFARETSRSESRLNQLVAFLLLDVCVETTMRTFLSLPDGPVQSRVKYFERRKYSEGSFHDLTKGIEAACATPVQSEDLHYVKFYHALRNQLYHQGTGITVAADDVTRYASVAGSLLKHLLGVDQDIARPPAGSSGMTRNQVLKLRQELRKNLDRFRELISSLLETIEPKLVYPSTIKKFSAIAAHIEPVSFPRRLDDFRSLVENAVEDGDVLMTVEI